MIISILETSTSTSTESTITISTIITITTGFCKTGFLITIETIFKVYKFYAEVAITMED